MKRSLVGVRSRAEQQGHNDVWYRTMGWGDLLGNGLVLLGWVWYSVQCRLRYDNVVLDDIVQYTCTVQYVARYGKAVWYGIVQYGVSAGAQCVTQHH